MSNIWRKLKWVVVPVLWIAVLFTLLSFASKSRNTIVCDKVEVKIADEDKLRFITGEEIRDLLTRNEQRPLEKLKLEVIEYTQLEDELRKNPYVHDAHIWSGMNGVVHVKIEQRKPVLRVINQYGQSFYIDDKGLKIKASPKFSAHVLLVSGFISEGKGMNDSLQSKLLKDVWQFNQYLEKNPFHKALVGQLIISANGELEIVPRIGNQKVVFGNFSNPEEKFTRLTKFYRSMWGKTELDEYKILNVKFKDQIIAKR